jgi:predicted ester cyclase
MTDFNANKTLARRFNDLFDAHDLDGCFELLSADFRGYATGAPGAMDRQAFRHLAEGFHSGFSNGRHDYKSQVAEGDKVATYAIWSATNSGVFNGIPPTGKRVEMEIFILDTISDGKIVEHRGYFDVMGLLTQIGAIPPAAAA